MRKLATTATALMAFALMAIAASPAHADTFACVNQSSGTNKIVPSCTVGTNSSPCHHNDICVDLSPPPPGLTLNEVCETESANAVDGSFNIDALCGAGQVVVAGGFQCTDAAGDLVASSVTENTFHLNNVTPDGWQTIGTTATDASCRVCATCTTGSVQ